VIPLSRGQRLVVASHNQGKVREIEDLLAPYGLSVTGADALNLPEPEETGATFADNAILKAEAAMQGSGLLALADDSGLCVEALDGAPGIYSARWAGETKDFRFAMKRVEDALHALGTPDPRAYFVCVLALAAPGMATETFEGRVYGTLTFPPRGDRGFGYDPIFVPDGYTITFGEMDPARKHEMSHRAVAFRMLVDGCFS
jgi:XTP/dITP diphosphohydrolase